ncbi:hypothetical protein FSP39_012722 [Pinctada imbricata]|uniref:non-specific serine/threonine protein kinase n=1 Tax=Pinctada imbricata TaxID=66713 RepID=A0AA88XRY7_PINIB|nr:hypothetical protein FSP39_012722 [Pinctada imbricata]
MVTKSVQHTNKKQSFAKRSFSKVQHIVEKYRTIRAKKITSFLKRVMPIAKQDKHVDPKDNGQFKKPFAVKKSHKNGSKKLVTVKKENVTLGKLLGSGGFGSVYLGSHKKETLAVKVMHKVTKNPAAQLESFKAELNILEFDHPYIVKFLMATPMELYDEGAWIVMEYAGDRTLQSVIGDRTSETLSPVHRIKFALQLASALNYSHQHEVVHLDLKPANILITSDGNIKLGDFGCSQKLEVDTKIVSPTQRSFLTGTFAYRAPELLKGESPSKKADIYSFGITLWQMLTRENPFANENQHCVIFSVVAYGKRPAHPDIDFDPFEECYRDLYTQCWSASSVERPSSAELEDVLSVWKKHL